MEAKQVVDIMEAYASMYTQTEETQEVISEEVIENKKIATGTGKKVMPSAEERSRLAKRARAGEDIGKKGPGFKEVAKKAAARYGSEEAGKRVAAAAMFKQQAHKEEVEVDLFDIILEYLVAEGFADTNENALVIMANMSEDWRQSIVEQMTDASTDSPSDENKSFSGEGPKKPKGWKPTGPKLKSGQRPGYAR